jgi:hypothetical protein
MPASIIAGVNPLSSAGGGVISIMETSVMV